MNIIEKLEKYFNTGSTDKQNKRRLGGLLIAITAILLVLAMIGLAVGGVWALVDGLFIKGDDPDDTPDDGINHDLVEVTDANEVINSTHKTPIVLDSSVPENMQITKFEDVNRYKNGTDKTGGYIYKATLKEGLQSEAETAFTAMMTAFHAQNTANTVIWADKAYNTDENATNDGHYVNALSVAISYEYYENEGDEDTKVGSIYNVNECKWIYENAYRYGFVRVSGLEGEENIFRYVGIAHAKYIYDQQQKKTNTEFYGIDAYIAEIEATTPDTEKSIKGVKEIGAEAKTSLTSYNVYYIAPSTAEAPAVYKLPDSEKFTYNVMATDDGGYIVTYWKTAKK